MIEASKMLVQASTTGGPASTCGPTGRMHPSAALGLLVLLLDLHKSRLQCVRRRSTADARSTYHQHSQRLIHALIIN